MTTTLKTELEAYAKLLPELLKDQGKFALIHGDALSGVYETYDDALQIGYDKFGIASTFLVKKILSTEQVLFFTRSIGEPCLA